MPRAHLQGPKHTRTGARKANQRRLGTELIANGSFASATGWTLPSEVTITGGKLNFTGTIQTRTANASAAIVSGNRYRVRFTVTDYTAGSVFFTVGGVSGTARTAIGTFEQDITATVTSGTIGIRTPTGSTVSIKPLSIRRLF